MTGVSECSQQRGSLKDDGYKLILINITIQLTIPYGFQVASRRQGNESLGA
ncbi:hypothetical protein GPY37_12285 [Photorhabdus kayaii]|uniref:Uncharacterized protein n=1 Tax=Photorhabdus kayaii TaxID=230088 RepID=A0ABX0B3P6_9GAMM|nr:MULTISPECIES: hypothetical protein [Photorhabdus]MDB6369295.1 hypothetical protein [Photorhabdus bodei]NDL12479.1 hypothetical protein [Photorhabdus kayaii]NDL26023.1 hypothetical protein [Photorhabdus kayaii]